MGFFSTRCNALIDADSGVALDGEALKQARQNRKAPRCKNNVKKTAKVCGKCGAPAPGGWAKCPGCGKWVGNDSQFCWSCSAPLHPEDRSAMSGGQWRKPENLLARRFDDVGDVQEMLRKGKIVVNEGSTAILMKGGEFVADLGPGLQTMNSTLSKINNWGSPPPITVVMIDSGDIALPIRVADLMTSEDFPVELYAEAHIRVASNKKHAQAFMSNVMKDSRELEYDAFTKRLRGEIRDAIVNVCNTSSIEDLMKDPDRRLHIENALQEQMKRSEELLGFELVRVSSAEFTGAAYEQLREANGALELRRRSMEFDRKLQTLLDQEKMDSFKSELELEEYIKQLAQEKDITDIHRDQEMKLLVMRKAGEITAEEAAIQMSAVIQAFKDEAIKSEFIMTAETKDLAHRLKLQAEEAAAKRAEELAQAKAAAEKAKITIDTDLTEHGAAVKKTTDWVEVKRLKKQMEEETDHQRRKNEQEIEHANKQLDAKLRIELIKSLSGTSLEDKIMVSENKDQIDALKELSQMKLQEGMSAQEILAMAAGKSPAAAQALADMAGMEKDQYERLMQDAKEMYKDRQEHDERMTNKSMDTVAEGLKNNKGNDVAGTTNIIK